MGDELESDPAAAASTGLGTPGIHAEALLARLRDRRSRVREPAARDGHGYGDHRAALTPLPTSSAALAALLDSCYFATLLTEEGRPTRIRLRVRRAGRRGRDPGSSARSTTAAHP